MIIKTIDCKLITGHDFEIDRRNWAIVLYWHRELHPKPGQIPYRHWIKFRVSWGRDAWGRNQRWPSFQFTRM